MVLIVGAGDGVGDGTGDGMDVGTGDEITGFAVADGAAGLRPTPANAGKGAQQHNKKTADTRVNGALIHGSLNNNTILYTLYHFTHIVLECRDELCVLETRD